MQERMTSGGSHDTLPHVLQLSQASALAECASQRYPISQRPGQTHASNSRSSSRLHQTPRTPALMHETLSPCHGRGRALSGLACSMTSLHQPHRHAPPNAREQSLSTTRCSPMHNISGQRPDRHWSHMPPPGHDPFAMFSRQPSTPPPRTSGWCPPRARMAPYMYAASRTGPFHQVHHWMEGWPGPAAGAKTPGAESRGWLSCVPQTFPLVGAVCGKMGPQGAPMNGVWSPRNAWDLGSGEAASEIRRA